MKHIKDFGSWVSESSSMILYRLIGGVQFGGAPVTDQNCPRKGQMISGVFATPRKDAINAMIDYCLEQGEDEDTGNPITEKDMRVLVIQATNTREPRPDEKPMHWEDSDKGEVVIEAGKIKDIIEIKNWK